MLTAEQKDFINQYSEYFSFVKDMINYLTNQQRFSYLRKERELEKLQKNEHLYHYNYNVLATELHEFISMQGYIDICQSADNKLYVQFNSYILSEDAYEQIDNNEFVDKYSKKLLLEQIRNSEKNVAQFVQEFQKKHNTNIVVEQLQHVETYDYIEYWDYRLHFDQEWLKNENKLFYSFIENLFSIVSLNWISSLLLNEIDHPKNFLKDYH